MKGLLLAEKPSVMKAIKEVYEKNKGLITDELDFGAFHGHLMGLKEPEEYDPAWGDRKNASLLPMIPSTFEYHAEDKDSVDRLMAKIRAGNYDFLVNACDAGREGEHIFWSFYESMRLSIPVKRLWMSSITAPAIKSALKDLKDSALFDNLRMTAKLRAQFDWLVGMNFTRAATIASQRFIPLGRVQTPTLKMIVDRELEIRNFKPETFYEVKCTGNINGTDIPGFLHLIPPKYAESRLSERAKAEEIVNRVKASPNGRVMAVKETVKEIDAPTLLSLAELEKSANLTYKFTLKHTDELAQQLYEAGYISYPRSESRYLPTDMIPELPKHIKVCSAVPELASIAAGIGKAEIDTMLKKSYVDDAGITDHHAIIPTDSMPDWSKLSQDEQKLYTLVCKSFLAIFLPPYKVSSTSIIIMAGNAAFGTKGKREMEKGYMVLYPEKKTKDVILPPCKQGDPASVKNLKITEGTTKPPARMSPRDVIAAMQHAGSNIPDSAMRSVLKETSGIGTSASRSEIIQKLEDRKLIELKTNVYWATDAGISLIEAVRDRNFASPILTAQWEEKLRAIEQSKYSGDFRTEMNAYVREETAYLLNNLKVAPLKVIGKCPVCGGDIIESEQSFRCANRKKDDPNSCWVWMPKTIGGYKLTTEDVTGILAGNKVGPRTVRVKTGEEKEVQIFLQTGKGLMVEFAESSIGKCPACGGKIIAYPNSYCCENHKQDDPNSCQVWIPKKIAGATISEQETITLLTERRIGPKEITRKDKKKWSVYFVLNDNNQIAFENAESGYEALPDVVCPICGGKIISYPNSYCCGNYKQNDPKSCQFWIPKNISGTQVSDEEFKVLVTKRKVGPKEITRKDKKKWKVYFILNDDNKLAFENAEADKVQVGVCPVCHKPVYEGKNSYYCEGTAAKTCEFSFPKNLKGSAIRLHSFRCGYRKFPLI